MTRSLRSRTRFLCELFAGVARATFSKQVNNFDRLRFPEWPDGQPMQLLPAIRTLLAIARRNAPLATMRERLVDDESHRLLLELLRYRVCGPRHVALPRNNDVYWKLQCAINQKYLVRSGTSSVGKFALNHYRIPGKHGLIDLHVHPLNVLNTFLLEQYALRRATSTIEAAPGDVVLDAGGCWGDTALYFADLVGPKGRVYCFEFEKENLHALRTNLELNDQLGETIDVVELAVWSRSGEILQVPPAGPATSILRAPRPTEAAEKIVTTTIDDFVQRRGLARVDMIKMDIEGAELNALHGAVQTICRYRPKLAISIYHSLLDFVEIPTWLLHLNDRRKLGYHFYLDHFTIHQEETILFGASRPHLAPTNLCDCSYLIPVDLLW